MTNPQKRKGSQFEREVADFLNDATPFTVGRAYGAGRPLDVGDIAGIPGTTIECKNAARIDLAGWTDETQRERENAGMDIGVTIIKRRRKTVDEAYVVMPLWQFAELVEDPNLIFRAASYTNHAADTEEA